MRLLRPRIFISYARKDAALADALKNVLAERGFTPFVDSADMMAGEDFVRRIDAELRSADAAVALLTESSVASEWCNAEWYFAHARGLPVIPIRFGAVEEALPDPLKLLEERIHYLAPRDLTDLHRVSGEIATQLATVRRRRRGRVAAITAMSLLVAALLVWGGIAVAQRFERMLRTRERNALVQRITAARQPLPGTELRRAAEKFTGDDVLLAETLRLSSDSYATDSARLNALMLSTELLQRRKPEVRWVLRNANWRNGIIEGGRLTDVTFATGNVQNLAVRNATLASVYWGKAPEMTLANSTFENVKFNAGAFSGTNVVGVKFTDCVFRGVEVDVTNFSSVEFRSTPNDELSLNGRIGAFENSVIYSREEAPDPNVMEIRNPAAEPRFHGIVFTGVRFRGFLRADFFRKCHFNRCTLPPSLTVAELERYGNIVTDVSQADESLD